ncbi:fumarate/nitrate reduction transcriptional regulator Fnr [Halomonas sp. HP20-15]|uniref:fumarate/nitrate reduction transcriptional regulator Fnr n=1 Tax=Halomonas sp. HP20-15 TaxID=3085901 RepID=UPI002981A1B7|nr:fumarate/nitrate reduction transcriptional regulator Fnr [Halomonas sp. HP20-15]MDW5375626.1 fumarate/nitrate reduction transcriptional regulator Fnr [Halomonas sp. HP20-15]
MTRIAMLSESRDSCHNCRLRTLCLPDNLPKEDIAKLEGIVQRRKPVSRGAYLFQAGQRFHSIYAVRTGAVKTSTLMANGEEHISGFHLPGEVIGLDAIVAHDHPSTAVALETASVCEIPYAELESLGDRTPALQHQLMRIMSRELLIEQGTNHLLTRRSAEQRLAVVLINFSERFASRGLSALRFRLPMSRLDLGNYLALVPETMSRTFRRLEEQGLVSIAGKEIEIIDIYAMKALAFGAESAQTARA